VAPLTGRFSGVFGVHTGWGNRCVAGDHLGRLAAFGMPECPEFVRVAATANAQSQMPKALTELRDGWMAPSYQLSSDTGPAVTSARTSEWTQSAPLNESV